MEYNCPLVNMEIDETVCYDIQMVTGNMINRRILQDYGFMVDDGLITKERAERLCRMCPFNQLMQGAQSAAHIAGKTATA